MKRCWRMSVLPRIRYRARFIWRSQPIGKEAAAVTSMHHFQKNGWETNAASSCQSFRQQHGLSSAVLTLVPITPIVCPSWKVSRH
jgi:hypothetical protein